MYIFIYFYFCTDHFYTVVDLYTELFVLHSGPRVESHNVTVHKQVLVGIFGYSSWLFSVRKVI